MNDATKNIILICALAAVAIMCVGLALFDYVPSGLTVSKANQYETEASTTEVLSDSQEAQELLSQQSTSSGTTSTTQKQVILQEYSVSKTDIAIAQSTGQYQPGRADPFAEVTTTPAEGAGEGGSTGATTVAPPDDRNSFPLFFF